MTAISRTFLIFLGLFLISPELAAKPPSSLPDPDGKPASMSKPVQVFILMGQSNMLGFGKVAGGDGSLEHAVKEKGKYPYLVDNDGNWTVRKDVRNVRVMCSGSGPWQTHKNEWMTISGNIGPEIGIGHHLGHLLDEPVLILKSCIGNRSLGYDLLPPSADGYQGNKGDPSRTPIPGNWYAGVQYDGDTKAAKDVLKDLNTYYPDARKFEVAGFFFWQGAKDLGRGGSADKYEENLVHFIKDLRKDFNAPDALFVCATMGQAQKGGGGPGGKITDAQLAVDGKKKKYPEFRGNVATFYSHPVSMGGSANGHYSGNAETYMNVGEGMGKAMVELLGTGRRRHSSTTPSEPPPAPVRKARRLAPAKVEELKQMLMTELVTLSETGKLQPVPMPLSMTKAKPALVGVGKNNLLSFRFPSGKTGTISTDKFKPVDYANLAALASKLQPYREDAHALAGVFLESIGRVQLADKYFARASPATQERLADKFFE